MSVVETTGYEIEALTADEARDITNKIRQGVALAWVLIEKAYKGRVWIALGYESWDAYTDAEFDGARLRLPREDRREVVASLRDAGMSVRAIGSALGMSHPTVLRDLSGGPDVPPDNTDRGVGDSGDRETSGRPEPTDPPTPEPAPIAPTITGRDGKTYPATKEKLMPTAEIDRSPAARKERAETIRRLAAEGHTSDQIAKKIGIDPKTLWQIKSDFGIEVPADKVVGKRQRIDPYRVIENTATALEGLVMGVAQVDVGSVDLSQVPEWVPTSMRESLTTLRKFLKEINP